MIDDDLTVELEATLVHWLSQRGYLIQKLEPVDMEIEGVKVEAYKLPETPETPLNRPLSRFDEFWQLYPRKIGKEAARKIFEKLPEDVQEGAIVGLVNHLEAEAFSSERCYIKHPSTWLNQKVYLDEPEKRSFKKPQIGPSSNRKALDDWLNS